MYNVQFDYAAILILAIIILYVISRKLYHTRNEKIFLSLVICSIVSTIADILSVSSSLGTTIEFIGAFIYFPARNLTIVLYILYVISISDTWHIYIKKKILLLIGLIPYMVVIVLSIANLFNQCLFYYDSNGIYDRGPLINALYIVAGIYIVIALIYIFVYRKLLRIDKIISVYIVFPLSVIAIVVQFLFQELLLEMLAAALSLLILFITVERPDDGVDSETGLLTFKTFLEDSRRAALTHKESILIIVAILSYSKYSSVYDHEYSLKLKRDLRVEVNSLLKKYNLKGTFYSINDGKYALGIDGNDLDNSRLLAKDLKNFFETSIASEHILIHFKTSCVVVNCKDDVENDTEMSDFIEVLGRDDSYSSDILEYSKLKENPMFSIRNNIDRITRNAIENKLFEVYYQPIYTINKKDFRHAEALLRLNDPTYGFISPGILIPNAEHNGTIHEIGDLVLDSVCEFIASDEFKELNMEYIEVNLSVAQCMDSTLPERMINILKKHNVDPKYINLEITETMDMYEQVVEDNINKLSNMGFKFSLDDYGTGYSNISRMSRLPLSLIKFDKVFVDNIGDPKILSVFRYSVNMIKAMKLESVIEGVETKEMADLFGEYKLDYIQGYYFSKPIRKNDFIEFVKKNNKEII